MRSFEIIARTLRRQDLETRWALTPFQCFSTMPGGGVTSVTYRHTALPGGGANLGGEPWDIFLAVRSHGRPSPPVWCLPRLRLLAEATTRTRPTRPPREAEP